MADLVTIAVPALPAAGAVTGNELVPVHQNGRLVRIDQRSLRGTRLFSGPSAPPTDATTILSMAVALGDRWRNTVNGSEFKATAIAPVVWTADGLTLTPDTIVIDPVTGSSVALSALIGSKADSTATALAIAGRARIGRTLVANAAYTALPQDAYIGLTSITASRTITLPAASSFPLGQPLYIVDETGLLSNTLIWTIQRAGSDTIAGQTSIDMMSPYQKLVLHSNGSNLWTY